MDFALVLQAKPEASGAAAPAWSPAQRDEFVRELRACDPQLGDPIVGDDDAISLVARKGLGLDWQIEPTRIVVVPQVAGVKPARAEQAFATLMQSVGRLVATHGLRVHSSALEREVDLESDHEALARAWIAHCTAAAQEHLQATRQGSNFNLVAVAVLLAMLLAATQLPEAWHPLLAVALSIPLGFLVLLWFRRRRERG
jgi:hypothetical protein